MSQQVFAKKVRKGEKKKITKVCFLSSYVLQISVQFDELFEISIQNLLGHTVYVPEVVFETFVGFVDPHCFYQDGSP